MSKVSVIVPVYNGEKTIERCVDSIIAQKYHNIEIVLVDDGSKDQSGTICDMLCEKYTKLGYEFIVIHQDNEGVSSARNTGIDIVSGEWFVFVDCDDIVKSNYISDMVSLQNSVSEYGHVCCGFISLAQGCKEYVYSEQEDISQSDRKKYMNMFAKVMVQSPCLRLYRTDIVRNNRLHMRRDISLGEDLLFNLEYFDCLKKTSFGIVNRGNYIYNDISDESLNRKYRSDLLDLYDLFHKEIKKYLHKWEAWDYETKVQYYNYLWNDYMIVLDNTFHKKNRMSFWKKIDYNNHILNRREFKYLLRMMDDSLSDKQKIVYSSGNYLYVLLLKQVYRLFSYIRRRIK